MRAKNYKFSSIRVIAILLLLLVAATWGQEDSITSIEIELLQAKIKELQTIIKAQQDTYSLAEELLCKLKKKLDEQIKEKERLNNLCQQAGINTALSTETKSQLSDSMPIAVRLQVLWETNLNGSGVVTNNNSISRVKLAPDNNVMVFHYNGGQYGIPTRVDKLNASTGNFVWPPPGYKTVTKPGERLSLNGWVDCNDNLFIMGSWSGSTFWKYDSELENELCSYTGGSGFEYVRDAINDELNNLYVAGMTGSGSNQGSRLVKLDENCNEIWTIVSKNTSGKDDYGWAIALDSSKNVFRVGMDSSSGASDHGRLIGHNASDGAELLNYTVNEMNSRVSGITIDCDDYIYIAYCYDYSPSGQEHTVVQKLERNGSNINVVWEYHFEDIGMYLGRDAIVKHTENSFYVAFNLRQDGNTVPGISEFDLDGNLLWQETLDKPGWNLSSIDAAGDNIYMGLTNSKDASKTKVLCITKGSMGKQKQLNSKEESYDTKSGQTQKVVIFEDDFSDSEIDSSLWSWKQTNKFSYRGTGKQKFGVTEKEDTLVIDSYAEHERGWTSIQDVWVDSLVDLKACSENIIIEIQLSGEAQGGSGGFLDVLLSSGKFPASRRDPESVRLFSASGNKNEVLDLSEQQLKIEIYRSSQTATVYMDKEPQPGYTNIDISSLDSWKLRFYVSTGTSAGFTNCSAQMKLNKVRVAKAPLTSGIIGCVIDDITNRGIFEATIRDMNGTFSTKSKPDGMYSLFAIPGKYVLKAEAENYEQLQPNQVYIEKGKQVIADIRMKKVKLGFGDVVESIPYNFQNISAIASHSGYIYYTGSSKNGHTNLYRMRFDGKELEELSKLEIGRGLAFYADTLYGLEAWPGRIYKVSEKGGASMIGRLNINWPSDMTFESQNLWYVENSGIDQKYGLYAINLESKNVVTHFTTKDKEIHGLAYGNDRLWISSLKGFVYEVDPKIAKAAGNLEAGIIRKFSGKYWKLFYAKELRINKLSFF
ncbi:MAG: hypothetical protein ISS77_06525 [Phycisphaerae bacterium]|nr:hypothetical protein [Phycisphaerae bacterium]